mgnify:CR=1 FL=1
MEIVQVYPQDNYDVVLYFVDGKIKKYNVSHLVGKGVFDRLKDIDFYKNNCTVLNRTLAWTLDGTYDSYNCLDLDPDVLYTDGIEIEDPLRETA